MEIRCANKAVKDVQIKSIASYWSDSSKLEKTEKTHQKMQKIKVFGGVLNYVKPFIPNYSTLK